MKEPRQERIYATTSNLVDDISISINSKTNTVSFGTEIKDAYSEITYDRSKGPKVVSRIPQNGIDLLFNHCKSIESNYEIIFAVDTNTWEISGKNISVTGIVQAQKVIVVNENGVATNAWKSITPFCIELMEVRNKPENLGWFLVIDHINKETKFKRFERVGIIVDSDLGSIKLYNSKEKPIFEKFYLPERFQLIYASSDTGQELLANRMLKYADKASNQCLMALKDGVVPINSKKVINKSYSGIRRLYSNYR